MTPVLQPVEAAPIARPLEVLAPLIRGDLKDAKNAAERAGLPYFEAAGHKLIEAKEQKEHGAFMVWVRKHVHISMETAAIYMKLAEYMKQNSGTPEFSSLSDFVRKTGRPTYNKPHTVRPTPWHEPVKKAVGRVNVEALNRDAANRAKERELQRTLALTLIDIGYKALAVKLHPDHGGSREAMSRLNDVRKRLKEHA